MEKIATDRRSLKKFGITMGIAFMVISLFILFRARHSVVPVLAVSAIFFICAFLLPFVLKPVYILWMKLAFVLGWINTRIVLIAIFYLLFTPIGLIMRLFGADLLERKIDKSRDSYWKKKEQKASDYERLF